MRKAALRHQITIKKPLDDSYSSTGEVLEWVTVGQPYVDVKTITNKESTGLDPNPYEVVQFNLPYHPAIENCGHGAVAIFRGREYEITGIQNLGYLDKELAITARFNLHVQSHY
ncbi:head-tail adaptor protein [Vibrio parahaemolyticus]|uniref:phage head completion protein n=1 Tax=Vibrio parahaemolyticus TaxID=670 RepID=UPI00301C6AD0